MIAAFVRWNRSASAWLGRRFPDFFESAPSYYDELDARIRRSVDAGAAHVLEAGGIDRPLLARGAGFRYDGLDIEEQPACHEVYDRFLVQSIEREVPGKYEVIFSMTLLEHVSDNRAAVRSIANALTPGGETHHYVPGSNHPYALATRLVGPRLQKSLIRVLRPNVPRHTSGYPTVFDACTPRAMAKRFAEAGLGEIDCRAYYRANDYFAWLVPFFVAVTAFENICRRVGWTTFASGFVISGRKPERRGAAEAGDAPPSTAG